MSSKILTPQPPLSPASVYAFVVGGGHTLRVERGVGGQYFGRRMTQLCALPISNPLCLDLFQFIPSTCTTRVLYKWRDFTCILVSGA